ncbi:hypothetical protein, partial [Microbacterium sp. 2FI]|uniref:hypothetical protein n=1 Tax=Microbacterium sp. 2FI TaxID=2502193 RepID=UPI001BB2922C
LRSQPPDQRPVLQSDHSPIVECSLFTAETDQFSSVVDTPKFPSPSELGGEVYFTKDQIDCELTVRLGHVADP